MAMYNPPHPGEFILETYLEPFDSSVRSLADSLGVAASTLNRPINRQSGADEKFGEDIVGGEASDAGPDF